VSVHESVVGVDLANDALQALLCSSHRACFNQGASVFALLSSLFIAILEDFRRPGALLLFTFTLLVVTRCRRDGAWLHHSYGLLLGLLFEADQEVVVRRCSLDRRLGGLE
jgi:hypothetical protein